ncbi:MAG TPA: protein translocase subunit SecD, partial [Dermatophilaceae bacterium]|nr:protein translocase subunit SecD [Dermatophilaceae bacterium]
MAGRTTHSYPRRALVGMLVLFLGLVSLLVGAQQLSNATFAPKLGLDLEGGTQIILEPRLSGAQTVSPEQISQARDIIVQRVDAGGVAGAEVTTQGGRNIVVSMPGVPDQATEDAIRRSSQMQFRPVLAVEAGSPQPAATPSGSPSGPASPSPGAAGSPSPTGGAAGGSSPTTSPTVASSPSATPTNGSVVPDALRATATPTPPAGTT